MTSKSSGISVIDKDMAVEGSLSCSGQLIIRGAVKGAIKADSVVISDEGAVYADTIVKSMVIGGIFEGDIDASGEITILGTGTCNGKVDCKNLIIEAGGVINADVNCTMVKEAKPENNHESGKKDLGPLRSKIQSYLPSIFNLNTAKSGK